MFPAAQRAKNDAVVENAPDLHRESRFHPVFGNFADPPMTTIPQPLPSAAPSRLAQGNVMAFAGVFLFALGFPAAEELLDHLGPITVITARIVLATAVLVPLWIWIEGAGILNGVPVRRALFIGGTGFGVGTVLLVVCQWLSNALTAALVATSLPIFAILLEVVLDGRRLTGSFLAGVALVLAGGYLATGASLSSGQFGLGAVLGIVASALFAWGSRAAVKDLPMMTALGQTTLTFVGTMLFCILCYVVFALLGWQGVETTRLDLSGWGALLLYAWGAMALSQLCWIKGVSKLGIGLASFHLNAAPFYVMLVLVAMGANWDWQKAAGALILGVGLIVAQRRTTF